MITLLLYKLKIMYYYWGGYRERGGKTNNTFSYLD